MDTVIGSTTQGEYAASSGSGQDEVLHTTLVLLDDRPLLIERVSYVDRLVELGLQMQALQAQLGGGQA